jgi:hypothetical protein
VLAMVGSGVLGAVGAAAGGACVAVALVLGATWFADRSTFTGLLSSGARPGTGRALEPTRHIDG